MDGFVVLNVVFGIGLVVYLGGNTLVAVVLWLVEIHGENDLVEWLAYMLRIHVKQSFSVFEDVFLWDGVEEPNKVVVEWDIVCGFVIWFMGR